LKPTEYVHEFNDPHPIVAVNHNGKQLYILRGESNFSIDRSEPVSAGIKG
jgi:hypothetical protein